MNRLLLLIATVVLSASLIDACLNFPEPTPTTLPPPPSDRKCPNIRSSSDTPGMAPLYNADSFGDDYIIVLKDEEDLGKSMKKISKMMSSNSRASSSMRGINGSAGGVKAIVTNLDNNDLNMIREMSDVKYVEKNGVVRLSTTWGLDRIDQRHLPLDNKYATNYSANGQYVYVIDTGVNTAHEDFEGRAVTWFEVPAVKTEEEDCNGHGTHVAGTIASATYGVASNATIISVRVFGCDGETSVANIIEGINHIESRGRNGSVVCMSLGVAGGSRTLDNAVQTLLDRNFVVVVAAGNDESDACNSSPGRVNDVITVGATDEDDSRSSFSNFGSGIDVFAPGRRITSLSHDSTDGTMILSGTSMAAPHVAGVAAILLSREFNVTGIRQEIIERSTKGVVVVQGRFRRVPPVSNNRLLFTD